MKITNASLKAALEALGRDADEVACNLYAADCTGCPASVGNCPIARYVSRYYGGARVVVFQVASVVMLDESVLYGDGVRTETPTSVWAFIRAFDRGAYPELVSA